jgi:hypothetical protein
MNRKLSLAALVFGLAVVASTQVQAQAPSWSAGGAQEASAKSFAPSGVHPSFINAQAPAGSAICYTCGNDWPVYEGTIPTAAAANEFGPGCSGGLSTAYNDHVPYLCSR